jgi:outer membrane immunogenic protein
MIKLGDRRTLTALGVLAVAAGTNPALAADQELIYKAAPAAIAPLPWTGFFVGSHVGWGEGQKKFIDNFPTPDGEVDADVRIRGWIGGLQGGYNQQFNWLVLGVEGDFTWSGVRNNNFSCFAFGNQVCSADAEWFSTLAGRVGVAFGPVLLYATGGIAWARDTFTDLATCLGSQPRRRGGIPALCGDQFIGSEIRAGSMVGAGFEYIFAPRWSVKVEYDYLDFGQRSTVLLDGLGNAFTEEIHQNVHLIKFGLNYKFGWGDLAPLWLTAIKGSVLLAFKERGRDEPPSHVLAFTGADVRNGADGWLGTPIAHGRISTAGPRVWLSGGRDLQLFCRGTISEAQLTGELPTGYA